LKRWETRHAYHCSIITLAFVGFATPAASACRVAPEPVFVPIWERAPTADRVQAQAKSPLWKSSSRDTRKNQRLDVNPDMIVTGCRSFQDLVRVIRVIAGGGTGRSGSPFLPGCVCESRWWSLTQNDRAGVARAGAHVCLSEDWSLQREYFLPGPWRGRHRHSDD